MTKSEEYRARAATAQLKALDEPDPAEKAKLDKLAKSWSDLALAADVHAELDTAVVDRGGRSNPIDFD